MSTCAREISPIMNRFVVFKTDDFSYHGHPVRAKRRRKSLGHPSHQGAMAAPMHHALARFHSEHVGN